MTGYIDPFYKICLDSFSIANKVVTMENFMQDISLGTVTGGISIWNMATVSIKCGDDDPACSATYSSLANAFSNTLCTADLDAAWAAFRDQYLNYKSSLLYEIVTLNTAIYPAIPLGKVLSTKLKVYTAKVDANWKAKIVGKAQKTGTPGHRFASHRKAITNAKKTSVKKVYMLQ